MLKSFKNLKLSWTKIEIENHIKTAALLEKIKNEAFQCLSENPKTSEYELQQFILKKFREFKLYKDKHPPIVAFGPSAVHPHYYPKRKSRKLKPNTLVLIDIWSRLKKRNAPFADITWMGFYGRKVPAKIARAYKAVIRARDDCLKFISDELAAGSLPSGRQVDEFTRKVLTRTGYGKNILHRTGHSIGFHSPHGKLGHISLKNEEPLLVNIGYTIEPGVYFKGEFGIRSEINFYINNRKQIVLTTPPQRELIVI